MLTRNAPDGCEDDCHLLCKPCLFLLSFLDSGTNGLDDDSATQFAELWDHTFLNLDQTFLFVDGGPLRSGASLDNDSGETERGGQQNDIWGPSRHTRLPMARRYRSRGTSRPERSPAIEG
ncbi:hypothetical protein scyTo_0024188 [Scyliorhinus torazame]|uniref:Uncharacterized protein n=1 Tax=Scyliorhinus torazame TaxID=75743 RepID=A0A401QEH7_SCYTO|nr:hypothetical protein [Scyliorhinus torazame]